MGACCAKKTTLYDIDPKQIPKIPNGKEPFEARVINVHDGDTITVLFLYLNETPMICNVRIYIVQLCTMLNFWINIVPLCRELEYCLAECQNLRYFFATLSTFCREKDR